MQEVAPHLPEIERAEAGAKCPYCGTDQEVITLVDADYWTVCQLCLLRSLDLVNGWNISRIYQNAQALRAAARTLPPRRRL